MRAEIKKKFLPLLLLAALFLLSCRSEKKMAHEFINRGRLPSLYVMLNNNWQLFFNKPTGANPNESYARRYFPYRTYSLKNNGTQQLDSLFNDSFLGKLKLFGFPVYTDTASDAFLAADNKKFVVEFLQMYIEEGVQHEGDTLFVSENENLPYDTLISRIDLSFWLRINAVDDTLLAAPTLFATFAITDFFEGSWEYDISSSNYIYTYSHAPLEMSDVLQFVAFSAKKLGQYVYDYFLNLDMYEQSKTKPEKYYTLNGRTIKPAGTDRFVFMSGN